MRRRGSFFASCQGCKVAPLKRQNPEARCERHGQEETDRPHRGRGIKLMAVPRLPEGVVERFLALGDPTGVISDTMDELGIPWARSAPPCSSRPSPASASSGRR